MPIHRNIIKLLFHTDTLILFSKLCFLPGSFFSYCVNYILYTLFLNLRNCVGSAHRILCDLIIQIICEE